MHGNVEEGDNNRNFNQEPLRLWFSFQKTIFVSGQLIELLLNIRNQCKSMFVWIKQSYWKVISVHIQNNTKIIRRPIFSYLCSVGNF